MSVMDARIMVEYCDQCGKQKLYVGFKPRDKEPVLQCIKCDKPDFKEFVIFKERSTKLRNGVGGL